MNTPPLHNTDEQRVEAVVNGLVAYTKGLPWDAHYTRKEAIAAILSLLAEQKESK